MAKIIKPNCHACGEALQAEDTQCPRCRVARKGDVNHPMIAAYALFLLVAFVAGTITITYLRNVTHVQ